MEFKNLALDQFQVIRTIGIGSFSHVNLCYHRPSELFCTLKVMSKRLIITLEQVEHVKSERNILAEVKHPNIVTVYGSFQDENFLYIMTEFIPGGEVFSHLRTQQCFDPDTVRFYAAEVFMVFEELHKHGIVYRDLKPENLLFDADGHIKFIDFGFAKHIEERTYTLCGTPEYLAPEIIRGEGTTFASDWWSYGILIHELISGQTPFADLDEDTLYRKICEGVTSYPELVDASTADFLDQLFILDPAKRLGSGSSGADDIKNHPYFEGIDWDKMRAHSYQTPLIPMVTSAYDTSNFADFTSNVPDYEPIDEEMKKVKFDNF